MKSERSTKILLAMGGMVRGGAETLMMHLLRSIDRNQYRIDILTHTEQPCAYDNEVRNLGSRIIPCLGLPNPWTYARNFRRVVGKYGPYDVVHAHLFYFNAMIMWLAARERIPNRIAHIHPVLDVKDLNSSFHEKLYNRGSGHTTPVAPADPLRHRAFLTSAPAAGAPLDAR